MNDNDKVKVKGVPIGNLLYTTEADASVRKTKAEIEIKDPAPERALGILNNNDAANKKEEPSEQSAS